MAVAFSEERRFFKRFSLRLMKTRIWQGTFAPRELPGLLRYYVPLRLPTGPPSGYVFPRAVEPSSGSSSDHLAGFSGSSIDLSTSAVLSHPGESSRCTCSLLGGW